MSNRKFKKSMRLRISLCMITAALTLLCMVAVVSAEGDGGVSITPGDAAQVVSDVTAQGTNPAAVQFTVVVVDSVTGSSVSNAKVNLSSSSAQGQTYGNETYFTVPAGGNARATVHADGYYPAQGNAYLNVTANIVETIALRRNPMTNTETTGLSNEVTATDIPQAGTPTDLLPPDPESSAPPSEGSDDVPSTYTDMPIASTPADIPVVSTPADLPAVPDEDSLENPLDQENQQVEQETPTNEFGEVPDTPPAWAESGQPYLKGNLGMAEQSRLLECALNERVDTVRAAFGISEQVQITYDPDNMADIWAVYALGSGMTADYPYGVELKTEKQMGILQSIFWNMTNVTATVQVIGGERVGVIRVERKTCADVLADYGLTNRLSELEALTTPDLRDTVNSQPTDSVLSTLSDAEFQAIEQQLRDLGGERRAVVLAALSLEGKIGYFWGGKSYHVGWDDRWGEERIVTSGGSSQTGTARPFGLDCSGFVSWAFINAGGDRNIIKYIGNGTSMQWYNSKAISMSELRPGDLLFYKPPGGAGIDHVGIYIGGGKVIHCTTGGSGGVIVTALGKFAYARTPYIYGNS